MERWASQMAHYSIQRYSTPVILALCFEEEMTQGGVPNKDGLVYLPIASVSEEFVAHKTDHIICAALACLITHSYIYWCLIHTCACMLLPLWVAVECPNLDSPSNGAVNATFTFFGSVATYTCNGRYTLIGSSEVTCTETGEWSSSPPECLCKLAIIPKCIYTVRVSCITHYSLHCTFSDRVPRSYQSSKWSGFVWGQHSWFKCYIHM